MKRPYQNNNEFDDEQGIFFLEFNEFSIVVGECKSVLEATAPWHNKPYEEQISLKEQEMKGVLTKCARKLRRRIDKQLGLSNQLKEEQKQYILLQSVYE